MNDAAKRLAKTLEETSDSVQEIASSVHDEAEFVGEMSANLEVTAKKASEGSTVLNEMVKATESIRSSGEKISEIVGVVNEIAFPFMVGRRNDGIWENRTKYPV